MKHRVPVVEATTERRSLLEDEANGYRGIASYAPCNPTDGRTAPWRRRLHSGAAGRQYVHLQTIEGAADTHPLGVTKIDRVRPYPSPLS